MGRVRPFLTATNEILATRGIALPLESQQTTTMQNLCKVARVGSNVSITVKNCYSTTDATSNGGIYNDSGTYTTATGADLVALLGSGWELSGEQPVPMTDETDLGTATVSGIDEYYLHDGTVQHPEPTVTDLFGNVLVKGTDYNVDWNGDGTIVGDYNVTVSGIGTYHGTYTTGYTVTEGIAVTSSTTTLEDGLFYKVYENVTNNNRITVNGTALLTLGTGATLTASKGITVEEGNTLTIRGEGSLTAIITGSSNYNAASALHHRQRRPALSLSTAATSPRQPIRIIVIAVQQVLVEHQEALAAEWKSMAVW